MKYDPTTRTIILGRKDCHACSLRPGRQLAPLPCKTCGGTGNGTRGGRGRCKACIGTGRRYDERITEPCRVCGGNYADADVESRTDTIPAELWAEIVSDLTITVIVVMRRGTWEEAHLGLHCLWSSTDYGALTDRMMKAADETAAIGDGRAAAINVALDHVVDHLLADYVQAIKVTTGERDSNVLDLADGLVLLIHQDGYKVVAHRAGSEVY